MTKVVLISSMCLNSLALLAFTQVTNLYLGLLTRFISGFFQVFMMIFATVWGDAFGSSREKSIMVMLFSMCSPLGVFVGFALSSIMASDDWKWAFYIEALLMTPCILGLAATSHTWLNIEDVVNFRNEVQKKVLRELNFPEDYLTGN